MNPRFMSVNYGTIANSICIKTPLRKWFSKLYFQAYNKFQLSFSRTRYKSLFTAAVLIFLQLFSIKCDHISTSVASQPQTKGPGSNRKDKGGVEFWRPRGHDSSKLSNSLKKFVFQRGTPHFRGHCPPVPSVTTSLILRWWNAVACKAKLLTSNK